MIDSSTQNINVNSEAEVVQFARYIADTNLFDSTQAHIHELYSLSMYIIASHISGCLEVPIHIKILGDDDPPDFLFTFSIPQLSIGLEHTRATIESYQIAKKELKRNSDYGFLESSEYMSKKNPHPRKAFSGLRKGDDRLTGPPIFGNADITNWVNLVVDAIRRKTNALSNWKNNNLTTTDLLIEVDAPNLIGDRHPIAISQLKKCFPDISRESLMHFDRIHVISQGRVMIDVFGETNLVELSKESVRRIIKTSA